MKLIEFYFLKRTFSKEKEKEIKKLYYIIYVTNGNNSIIKLIEYNK
ncbi:hypothetical protein CCP3SC1AL1_3910001 [Gammaproteobacteria bacterium]